MRNLAKNLRKALVDTMRAAPEKKVAVLMSSGVDSHTVLFSALEAGKDVSTYSFTLADRESRDFKIARDTAAIFGLPFTKISLPTDLETLIADVFDMLKMGAVKKTHVECLWPMLYAIESVKERVICTGHGADNYYCLSRKAYQHYKGRADEYRSLCFEDPYWSQKEFIQKHAQQFGRRFLYQYHEQKVFDVFNGTTYEDLNKPHQKSVSRDAFADYFERCRVYTHMPFQLGDSGIAEHFTLLLDTEYNTNGYKSVVGVYNAMRKQL